MQDTARALGARNPKPITIAGKDCFIRPLAVMELIEMEKICLNAYQESVLRSYLKSLKIYYEGDPDAESKIREAYLAKSNEVSKWDADALPDKIAYDIKSLQMTPKVEKWLATAFDVKTKGKPAQQLLRLLGHALDSEMLSEEKYMELSGATDAPRKAKIGYVPWWPTATYEGQLEMIWMAFKTSGITKDELSQELAKNPALMIDTAARIEEESVPSGNG